MKARCQLIFALILLATAFRARCEDCLTPVWIWRAPTNTFNIRTLALSENGSTYILGTSFERGWNAAFVQKYGGFRINRIFDGMGEEPTILDAVADAAGNLYWSCSYHRPFNYFQNSSTLHQITPAGVFTTNESILSVKDGYAAIDCLQLNSRSELTYRLYNSWMGGEVRGINPPIKTDADAIYRDFANNWVWGKEIPTAVRQFVVGRLDASGAPLWARQFGGISYVRHAAAADGIYIRGWKDSGAYTFGSIVTATNAGSFVLKLDYDGNVISFRLFPSYSNSMYFTPSGGYFVAGAYDPSSGRTGAVLSLYDKNGNLVADYSNPNGSPKDYIYGLTMAKDGLYVTARLDAPGRLGCTNLVQTGSNWVVAKFQFDFSSPPTFATVSASRENVELGGVINLYSAAIGTAPLSFQWLHNGSIITNATGSSLVISNALASDAGNYSVKAVNSLGSIVSDQTSIIIMQPLELSLAGRENTNLRIAWPSSGSYFRLQQTADLFSPFTNAATTPTTNTTLGRIEVSLPTSSTQQFFRLASP